MAPTPTNLPPWLLTSEVASVFRVDVGTVKGCSRVATCPPSKSAGTGEYRARLSKRCWPCRERPGRAGHRGSTISSSTEDIADGSDYAPAKRPPAATARPGEKEKNQMRLVHIGDGDGPR